MTFADIQADLYRRLGLPTSPVSATSTRLNAFINETQQELLSEPGMEVILRDRMQFASVASTPEYGILQSISRIAFIRDTTNRRVLGNMSPAAYFAEYPSPADVTGLPSAWVDLGISPVSVQPADASELFIVSTSASDDSSKSVTVEGFLSSGAFATQTTTLNGITAKSLSATLTTWLRLTKFEIVLAAGGATTAAGTVSLLEDSGAGTTLGQIYGGLALAKYRHLALAPTPASAVTYTVDFEREVSNMSNATDEPILPARFHRLLATGARMKEYEKTDNTRYLQARDEYSRGLAHLKYWLHTQAAGQPNMRGRVGEPPSRLGAWYPSLG